MASRFVRSSKYRHVFGTAFKQEYNFENLKVSKSAWDTNKVAASTRFIGVCWEAGGGGQFAVVDQKKPGKMKAGNPMVSGHKAAVLDLDFSPFNPNVIASAGEDGYAYIWAIPENGLEKTMFVDDASQTLKGHRRKVGTVNWHPTAENIIATSSTDYTVKIWDVTRGAVATDITGHSDNIGTVAWNLDGSLLVTASKDKKSRIIDPRSGTITETFSGHEGAKGSRALWLGKREKVMTVGMSKMSERQFRIWDPRKMDAALASKNIDTASGMLMPFYDDDTSMLFFAGKGDGNIRYFELVDDAPFFYFLAEFKSNTSQIGMAMQPKLSLNVGECEVTVMLKATPFAVEPVSFKVPRKSDLFQDDLFPDTPGEVPALTSDEWLAGKNAPPKLVSLESGYEPPKHKALEVSKVEVKTEKELTTAEMKTKITELENRVAYLETELTKKDLLLKSK